MIVMLHLTVRQACHTWEGVYCLVESGPRVPLIFVEEVTVLFCQFCAA